MILLAKRGFHLEGPQRESNSWRLDKIYKTSPQGKQGVLFPRNPQCTPKAAKGEAETNIEVKGK